MYYLILSWRDCVERLTINLDDPKTVCPICYKELGSMDDLKYMLSHMKRCYCLYRIENSLRTLPTSATDIDKALTVSQTSGDTEVEISNYLLSYLQDEGMIG
jgi:hypothetical protein